MSRGAFSIVLIAVAAVLAAAGPAAATGRTERVSVASGGTQATDASINAAISADGRYVAFLSAASNLVAGDTNLLTDVFVRDRVTGVTERVSVASGGAQANGRSDQAEISADGRFVAFKSFASNLGPLDTNGTSDVFVRDLMTDTTERVSISTLGGQANGLSEEPAISADGRYVAFQSFGQNVVAGDTNAHEDIFVRDRLFGTTERVSVATDGTQANAPSLDPAISADGSHVAFESTASSLVAGDTNGGSTDVFVHSRGLGATQRVSVASDGTQANAPSFDPALSADGSHVAFESNASTLVAGDTNSTFDVFVRDVPAGTTERASVAGGGVQANGASADAAISADGRYVAFQSFATNLVAGDTNGLQDIYVRDRQVGATERVSLATGGGQTNHNSFTPAINADGRYIGFHSQASNLVVGDTNADSDVFLRDRDPDGDEDGVPDDTDNCPNDANPGQEDSDGDGLGDTCDPDDDNDGVPDQQDAFPLDPSESADGDSDGVGDNADNCPVDENLDQVDTDGDGLGDACDPHDDRDPDLDGVPNSDDNCPDVANPDQQDTDGDRLGDACDPDDDGDNVPDEFDAFPLDPSESADADRDRVGDNADNCPAVANPDQRDADADGRGDACDGIDSTPGCVLGIGQLQSNPKAGIAFKVSYTAGAERPTGGLVFVDKATGRFLTSTKITSLVIAGNAATITGVGKTNGGRVVDFEAEATDQNRSGRLGPRLSPLRTAHRDARGAVRTGRPHPSRRGADPHLLAPTVRERARKRGDARSPGGAVEVQTSVIGQLRHPHGRDCA